MSNAQLGHAGHILGHVPKNIEDVLDLAVFAMNQSEITVGHEERTVLLTNGNIAFPPPPLVQGLPDFGHLLRGRRCNERRVMLGNHVGLIHADQPFASGIAINNPTMLIHDVDGFVAVFKNISENRKFFSDPFRQILTEENLL